MIKKYFQKYNFDRTQKANLNTIVSMFFKGGSILLSFILVPLTINYIKPDVYGVWITLSSLVGLFAMVDIGIANGLKNKLSESLADKNYIKSKMYVSSTYVIIGLIGFCIVCIYLSFFQFISWQSVFNSTIVAEDKLRNVVTIVVILFVFKFVSDIITVVAAAFQTILVSSFLLFLSNLGITLSIYVLSLTKTVDIILLAFIFSFIPFIISVIASFYLFKNYLREVKPSFKYVNFKESKSIISLGFRFFIIQVISIVIFQTDNILIAHFFDPIEVTNFSVAYKYYSIVVVIFTVILTPYWTAFTEAYFKRDYNWIKMSINRLVSLWIISLLILILMFFTSDWFIKVWLGNTVKIPISLSLSLCAYIAVMNWNAIFANFLNGIGIIRVQIYYALIMVIVNLPLSFIMVKVFKFGTFAMPLSNLICLLLGSVISFIQYKRIINDKAFGIWGV